MDKLSLDKNALRKFGITMGCAFAVIAMILAIRDKHNILPASLISVGWFIFAFAAPQSLEPLYILWMKFAFVLNWFNTRIILFIIFYLIFSPIGIVMRIFGIDLLNRKSDKNKNSYWQNSVRKNFNRLDYERQF